MIFLITMTIGFSIGLYLMSKNSIPYTFYIDPEFLKRKGLINDLECDYMKNWNKKQDIKHYKYSFKYFFFTIIITFPLSIILELLF